jgi:hypothetical protein
MRIGNWQIKRRVVAGLAGGLAVVVVWIVWSVRVRPAGVGATLEPQPFVRFVGTGNQTKDRVLHEQAEYLDPTPLFFPAIRNYEQRELPGALKRQASELFGDFPEKLSFAKANIPTWGAAAIQGPERLTDVLAQGVQAPFAGFTEIDQVRSPLPARSAKIEVTALSSGKVVVHQMINSEVKDSRQDAEPVQFLLAVASTGMVGELVPVPSGAPEETVASSRRLLEKNVRLDLQLEPGTYWVMVGP